MRQTTILLAVLLVMISCSASAVTIDSIKVNPDRGIAPLNVRFSATLSGSDTYDFYWTLGDGFTTQDSSFSHSFSIPGTYTVKLKVVDLMDANHSDEKSVSVLVYQSSLDITIITRMSSDYAPAEVYFSAAVMGSTPTTYEWDFNGDNVIDSFASTPKYTYSKPGNYTVKLFVSNIKGERKEKSMVLNIPKFSPKIEVKSYSPKYLFANKPNNLTLELYNYGDYFINIVAPQVLNEDIISETELRRPLVLSANRTSNLTIEMIPLSTGKQNISIRLSSKVFALPVEVIREEQPQAISEDTQSGSDGPFSSLLPEVSEKTVKNSVVLLVALIIIGIFSFMVVRDVLKHDKKHHQVKEHNSPRKSDDHDKVKGHP